MTVKELYDALHKHMCKGCQNDNKLTCSMCTIKDCGYEKYGNHRVLLFDDNKHFSIKSAKNSKFNKEVKPAKIEIQDVKYTPPGKDGTKEDYIPSYCSKCKNFKGYTGKTLMLGQKCIDCNYNGEVIHNVLEYNGDECMAYDPIVPVIRKLPVVIKPAKYKTEDVLTLSIDTKLK